MNTWHRCEPMQPYCCCYLLADEPSEHCPIHGGAMINRCECGRFVRRPPVATAEPEVGKQNLTEALR